MTPRTEMPRVLAATSEEVTTKRKVFVSYVRDDKHRIDELVGLLRSANIPIWVDTLELRPGARWKDQIRNAIRDGAFFLAVFSANSESRQRTYMREELAIAVEEVRLRPRNLPWLVPVLLDDVPLPELPLGPSERLSDLQAATLYPDLRGGAHSLVEMLRSGLGLDVSTEDIDSLLLDLSNRQVLGQTYSLRIEFPDGTVRIGVPKYLQMGKSGARVVVATSQGDIGLDSTTNSVVRAQYE
jgi:hypothetical protein